MCIYRFISIILLPLLITIIDCRPINNWSHSKSLHQYGKHPMYQNYMPKDQVLIYLRKYGYLPNNSKHGYDSNFDSVYFRRALFTFQKLSGLPVTGELDEETVEIMKKPRCGVVDVDIFEKEAAKLPTRILNQAHKRIKRFSVHGTKLSTRDNRIRYSINAYSKKLSKPYVDEALDHGFEVWSKHIPVDFEEVTSGLPTEINVRFATKEHGDGQPFDGLGRDLAHAFYPEKGSDVHFDDDEPWGPNGRNLLWVAAHEIGHSLGLKHSSDRSSLMHATYGGYGKQKHDIALTHDDIAGIQSLYGRRRVYSLTSKKTQSNSALSTNKKTGLKYDNRKTKEPENMKSQPAKRVIANVNSLSVEKPNICNDASIDAMIVVENGTVFAFKGSNFWRLNIEESKVEDHFPRSIKQQWPNLPNNIDAAVQEPFTVIIKGNKGSLMEENDYGELRPQPLMPLEKLGAFGHLPQRIDASLSEGSYDGSFWFFKGTKYWRDIDWDGLPEIDPLTNKEDYMNLKQIHPIFRTQKVDAAVNISEGPRKGLYLFVGTKYIKVFQFRGRLIADRNYPRDTGKDWFGCGK